MPTWSMLLLPTTGRMGTDCRRPLHPVHCYRIELHQGKESTVLANSHEHKKTAPEQAILCRVCCAAITTPGQGMAKDGLHEHVFFNPAGIAFEIRCYKRAPGCLIRGEPTAAFSWFDGYNWQYALCSTCLTHLGWWFTTRQDSFFGLIANRLME